MSKDSDSENKIGSGYRVFRIGEQSRVDGTDTTAIRFASNALPFRLENIVFGDYSSEPVLGTTYYAGSGMILNVTGPSGNITLKEPAGKLIRLIHYEGQATIVLNGETTYTSTKTTGTQYEGTDILVQDWLKGTWSPETGVVLERPAGMTIVDSELYLMVFQSQASVPEFGLLPVVGLTVLIVCAFAARAKKKAPA